MIINITDKFLEYAQRSAELQNQFSWNSSIFIKNSTSYLSDTNLLQSKLVDLEKQLRSGSRFDKQVQMKKIMNVKENLKLCEKNIKRLKTVTLDIKSKNNMAQKLKDSILVTLEMKLLQHTFKLKDLHLLYANRGKKDIKEDIRKREGGQQRAVNLNRSHFLQQSQQQIMQQATTNEYKEIERSITQISEMYKQTMSVVRMHQIMIDSIEGHIDKAENNVGEGRKNLTELSGKQRKNRSLIMKIFSVLYLVVFVYLILLV